MAQIAEIEDAANRMRLSAIAQVDAAKSGHATSSLSAAEIVASLFFGEMRYDVKHPRHPAADRFVLSKGHACPILYAAWEEAGLLSREQVLKFRLIDSDLEGHPTPRLNFIDVATGSLGQGLSCAAGMAYAGKYVDKASYRVYCLIGDGESAEGAIWECASFSSFYNLDNLVCIVDVNRLGQSQVTSLGHDLQRYAARFSAFGWHTISVTDGHNVSQLLNAYAEAKTVKGKPTVILAKTLKGKGLPDVQDKDGYHGKPVASENADFHVKRETPFEWNIPQPKFDVPDVDLNIGKITLTPPPDYKMDDKVATRAAYGNALLKLAKENKRVIAMDGDVSNSTFSSLVKTELPDQFVECFIAEQNMVGVGVGLSCRQRAMPFISSFGAFLGRAFDHIRMGAVSMANVKYAGSHCGISVGEDGPSQMALEDLAQFRALPGGVVLYPSDAVSTEHAMELVANYRGPTYIRLSRPNVPILYDMDEKFAIGKAKLLHESPIDRALLIGAGTTLFECLKAHCALAAEGIQTAVIDLFSVKPLDFAMLKEQAIHVKGKVVTVEDHYEAGGIGEAVAGALSEIPNVQVHRLYVTGLPRSGKPETLYEHYCISSDHVVKAVKEML